MLRAVLLVMGGTLASRVLGLVRQAVFNALYPDALKDAFNVAYRVPNLLRELLAEGAVQNALIPLLKSLPPEEAQAFARRFAAFWRCFFSAAFSWRLYTNCAKFVGTDAASSACAHHVVCTHTCIFVLVWVFF